VYKLLPESPKVPDAPLAQVTFGVEPFQSMMEEALNCYLNTVIGLLSLPRGKILSGRILA
jgi:hypothetical protein